MKTHQRNGFTLIELIVVIAILAILALLIVPQVTGYTTAAQKTVCQSNMQTTIRQYFYDKIGIDSNTAESNLKTSTASGKICPSGGTITYSIDGDTVTLVCSKHGSVSAEESQFANSVISSVSLGKISRAIKGSTTDQTLAGYFGTNPTSTHSIDSGNDGTSPEGNVSFTSIINGAIGTNFSGYWTMRKENGSYVLYVSDTALTTNDVGKTISVTKYVFSADGTSTTSSRTTAKVYLPTSNVKNYVTLKSK